MDKSSWILVGSLLLLVAILRNADQTRKMEALKPTPQSVVAAGECDGPYNGYNERYEMGYETGRDAYRPKNIGAAAGIVIQSPPDGDQTPEHACWAAGYDAGYLSAQH